MTEKRFELIWETDEMCNVFDNDLDVNSTISVEEVVDLLNELAEENEQSKMMISTLRNIVLENEDLEEENKKLKKENEQLEQKYDKVVKFIRRNHDVCMIHRILKGDDEE